MRMAIIDTAEVPARVTTKRPRNRERIEAVHQALQVVATGKAVVFELDNQVDMHKIRCLALTISKAKGRPVVTRTNDNTLFIGPKPTQLKMVL